MRLTVSGSECFAWLRSAASAAALAGALAAALSGCASGPRIDTTHSAVSQGPRADLVIIHYTALDFAASLRVLTQQTVSSHYLVGIDPPTIYRLVPDDRRANHAGVSSWRGRNMLNHTTIGIEIVNLGLIDGPQGPQFVPYPASQIDAVVVLLKDIVRRHGIAPDRIVGHTDIAPGRKIDPGPLFPWKRLADEGLIRWPDAALVASQQALFMLQLPDVAWFQQRLAELGYLVPQTGVLDNPTRAVLVALQMRFRPARHDGEPDAETAAILVALRDKPAP